MSEELQNAETFLLKDLRNGNIEPNKLAQIHKVHNLRIQSSKQSLQKSLEDRQELRATLHSGETLTQADRKLHLVKYNKEDREKHIKEINDISNQYIQAHQTAINNINSDIANQSDVASSELEEKKNILNTSLSKIHKDNSTVLKHIDSAEGNYPVSQGQYGSQKPIEPSSYDLIPEDKIGDLPWWFFPLMNAISKATSSFSKQTTHSELSEHLGHHIKSIPNKELQKALDEVNRSIGELRGQMGDDQFEGDKSRDEKKRDLSKMIVRKLKVKNLGLIENLKDAFGEGEHALFRFHKLQKDGMVEYNGKLIKLGHYVRVPNLKLNAQLKNSEQVKSLLQTPAIPFLSVSPGQADYGFPDNIFTFSRNITFPFKKEYVDAISEHMSEKGYYFVLGKDIKVGEGSKPIYVRSELLGKIKMCQYKGSTTGGGTDGAIQQGRLAGEGQRRREERSTFEKPTLLLYDSNGDFERSVKIPEKLNEFEWSVIGATTIHGKFHTQLKDFADTLNVLKEANDKNGFEAIKGEFLEKHKDTKELDENNVLKDEINELNLNNDTDVKNFLKFFK